MKYLLDTCTCVDFLRGRWPSVRARIEAQAPKDLALRVITAAELRYGAERSGSPARNHMIVDRFLYGIAALALPTKAAPVSARIRRQLEQGGQINGANDLPIASHALAADAALVTSNVCDFQRVEGLRWVDWRE